MDAFTSVRNMSASVVGGSTVVLDVGGVRLITDPTFDPPSDAGDRPSRTVPPALAPADLGTIDVALVSHDQHPDNLDDAGRALLTRVGLTLTTVEAAERLGGRARGLRPYEHVDQPRPDGGVLRITALPARHGPVGAEAVLGTVVGFLLDGEGLPSVYVSGDNASVEVVHDIVGAVGTVDVAVLFAGAASVPQLVDGAPLTLTSADAAKVAGLLGARKVVLIHHDGWTHYREDREQLERAFRAAGLAEVLVDTPAGRTVSL